MKNNCRLDLRNSFASLIAENLGRLKNIWLKNKPIYTSDRGESNMGYINSRPQEFSPLYPANYIHWFTLSAKYFS
jgi:hypothetical protein